MVNTLIIVMLLRRTRTKLVGSIVLFELVHLYSHASYHPGLSTVQHLTMYLVLHYYARPGRWTRLVRMADVVALVLVGGIWQIYSGIALLYTYCTDDHRVKMGALAVALLLANEQVHCLRMLEHADLPYHIVLELMGMYVFHCMTERVPRTAIGQRVSR